MKGSMHIAPLAVLIFLIVIIFIGIIAVLDSNYNKATATTTIFYAPLHQIFVTTCYYGHPGGNVVVINASSYSIVKSIGGFNQPIAMTALPGSDKVFVANAGSNVVSVIDTKTDTVIKNITVGNDSQGIVFSPDGAKAYIIHNDNAWTSVAVINTTTYSVTNMIRVGYPSKPWFDEGLAISPDGSRLYVANGYFYVISTDNNTVIDVMNTSYVMNGYLNYINLNDLVVSPDGARLFAVPFGGGHIYVINTTTYTMINNFTGAGSGNPDGAQIAISPNGAYIYVTNITQGSGNDQVDVINTSTYQTVNAIPDAFATPFGVSVSPSGAEAVIANRGSISFVNTTTYSIVNSINAGTCGGIAIT